MTDRTQPVPSDLQPIIIGVAQQTWRDTDTARTPVDALQAVAAQALSDAGSERVIADIDCVVQVPFILTQEPTLAAGVPRSTGAVAAERLGIDAPVYSADTGGDLPQTLLTHFAARLQSGECRSVLLFGAELLATFLGALRSGAGFPEWSTGREDNPLPVGKPLVQVTASEALHGLFQPVNTYPLFESALRHANGWDSQTHRQRIGQLVADMSKVSSSNPLAWKQQRYSTAEVLSTKEGNRLISHPYTKLMNAVFAVDQAAAVVLTTVGQARRQGVDPSRWIYLRGAAGARDTGSILERESYHRSEPLRIAASAALQQSGLSMGELALIDLYSCFPSAVQVACDALDLRLDDPRGLSVTGGMTLFGGPGNNYSLHAIAEMVSQLRDRACQPGGGDTEHAGIVTANGGYLSKHAVGIYSTRAGKRVWTPVDEGALQKNLDARPVPATVEQGEGQLTIEAYTVHYSRGEPSRGIVLGHLSDGNRCVAISDDSDTIAALLAEDCVGHCGEVRHRDDLNHFQF